MPESPRYRRFVLAAVLAMPGLCPLGSVADSVDEAELEAVIEEVRATYFAAREKLEQLPRDRFDRMWVLEETDFDAERIVDWIIENTDWVPYRGTLRDADGVQLDRQGNSLDRSLLLRALLQDAGYEARLVNGELSAGAAERLLQRARIGQYEPVAVASYDSQEARAVVSRAAGQAADLAKIVALRDDSRRTDLIEATVDHWWVEAKIASDWQTLDPQIEGTSESLRPPVTRRFASEELPEQAHHRVTARVVTERWDKGTIREEVPLEQSFRISDSPFFDLELQFLPFGFDLPPDGSSARAEILSLAETTREWLPAIRMGTAYFLDQGFDTAGRIVRNPARLAMHRSMESATAGLAGMNADEQAPEPVLSALWIEYEISVPGRDAEVVRREVFDLIGPARRNGDLAGLDFDRQAIRDRGLALAGTTRILITGSLLPPVVLEKASLELWARQGPQIAALARLIADPQAEEPQSRLYGEPLISLDLLGFAIARGAISRHREAIYQGRPNVFTTHYVPELGDDLVISRSVDLVSNEVDVVPGDFSPAAIRLEQGVLDTMLEAALSPTDGMAINTAELFSQRGRATGEWTVVSSWPEDSSLPASARARMATAVAEGRIVVAPAWIRGGHEPTWWEIDTSTGTTLGIGPKGWGVMVEEATKRTIATLGTRQGTRKTGITVACKIVLAHLKARGMTIRMLPGPDGPVPVLTPHIIKWLMSYGCK